MQAKKMVIDHAFYMREALKEAEDALKAGNWPIGAVIVLDGKIISRASNKVYTDVDKTHHAELLALQMASLPLHNQGQRAILYSTYELCPMCLGAALTNHVGTIVCGPDLDGTGAIGLLKHLPPKFLQDKYAFTVITDVLEKECVEIALRGIPEHKLSSKKVAPYKKLYNLT